MKVKRISHVSAQKVLDAQHKEALAAHKKHVKFVEDHNERAELHHRESVQRAEELQATERETQAKRVASQRVSLAHAKAVVKHGQQTQMQLAARQHKTPDHSEALRLANVSALEVPVLDHSKFQAPEETIMNPMLGQSQPLEIPEEPKLLVSFEDIVYDAEPVESTTVIKTRDGDATAISGTYILSGNGEKFIVTEEDFTTHYVEV